jgi:hypothetical protein
MAFVEDFTVFFTDFGVPATPDVGAPFTVIFDRDYMQALQGAISGTQPVALAQDSDLAAVWSGTTTLTINGNTYTVEDVQPDGTGLSILILSLEPP